MTTSKITAETKTLFKVYATNIEWDCSKHELDGLPRDMLAVVPAYAKNTLLDDELADFLSDEFGFAIDTFEVETIEEVKDEKAGVIEFTPW